MELKELDKEIKTLKIAKHIEQIMRELEIEPSPDNLDTPKRVAQMYIDVFCNANKKVEDFLSTLTTFEAPSKNTVLVRNVPFSSYCAHHWLPFFGVVDVEYIPDDHIIGLSKIPRLIKWLSKKPQVQENLTEEIISGLARVLNPTYIKVIVHHVTHTCVQCRGAESVGVVTDTIAERGERRWI